MDIKIDSCARVCSFCSICAKFSERQILLSFFSVDFHTFTLQLPIQTLHSVLPQLQVFVSSLKNCQNFSKTSTPMDLKYSSLPFNTLLHSKGCLKHVSGLKIVTRCPCTHSTDTDIWLTGNNHEPCRGIWLAVHEWCNMYMWLWNSNWISYPIHAGFRLMPSQPPADVSHYQKCQHPIQQPGRGGPRNMKSIRPLLAAIFLWLSLRRGMAPSAPLDRLLNVPVEQLLK